MGAARLELVQTATVITKTNQLENLFRFFMEFLLSGPPA
jgi:hypothetical protein